MKPLCPLECAAKPRLQPAPRLQTGSASRRGSTPRTDRSPEDTPSPTTRCLTPTRAQPALAARHAKGSKASANLPAVAGHCYLSKFTGWRAGAPELAHAACQNWAHALSEDGIRRCLVIGA